MKYIKTPVYEFDELSEKAKQKVIDKEREFYELYICEQDLDFVLDSDKCPLNGSGVSIDGLKDLSYDLSNYQYDHVAFMRCTLDKDVLIEKSGALDLIRAKLEHTLLNTNTFLSNLDISWRLPAARDYFCTSGEVVVDGIDYWDDITDEWELAEDLAETVAECLTEYMHNLQRKLYDYLIDTVNHATSNESIIENLDPDMVYDQDGICYSVEEVEEE